MVIALIVALAFQPAPSMLRSLFEEELAQTASKHGEADPRTAQAARDLGLFLVRQGDPAAARNALEQAVRGDEKAFGPSAPQTLADLADLASVSAPPEAGPMWLRASASPDAAVAARSLSAVGDRRERDGDRAGAIAWYRRALEKEELASGRSSLRVAARLNTLALMVDSTEGIALLERALRISTTQLGVQRLETASIQMNLAGRLLNRGHAARAAQLAKAAASTFAEILGPEHPRSVASRNLRAQAAALTKRPTGKQ